MASIKIKNVYIKDYSTISSNYEKINTKHTISDFYDSEKTFEQAEIKMQKTIIKDLEKNNEIDCVLSGELSNQLGISNKALSYFNYSYLGLYNACATFVEELIVASSLITSSSIKNILALTSSHNLAAERTFRYPVEYGIPKKRTQSFTATGAVGMILTNTETNIKLDAATIGKVIDYGIKDTNNMGAIMAPGAALTLIEHLEFLKRDSSYYDVILTGDLGKLGSELFNEILSNNDIILKNHIDAGKELITDSSLSYQGASGPICLPLYLCEKILSNKKYKRILIIGTGSLQNTNLVNQKNTIPGIAHAISLEVQ